MECLGDMSTPSDALLARYLAGECAADETDAIEAWAAAAPAHRARVEQLRAIWAVTPPVPAWDVSGMWTQVHAATRVAMSVEPKPAPVWRAFPAEGHRRWRWPLAAAAALLVAAGATFVVWRGAESPNASAPAATREYATARGQRATLQLPDGTRLVLAPASRLRISPTFGQGAREVVLEGEALFDVVHDGARPFRVFAKNAVAEDIGTRFDVRAYAEDSVIAVAVAEGAVALGRATVGTPEGQAQGVVLREGELGTLGATGQVTTVRGGAVAEYLGWDSGRLAFVDAPLESALARLNRWYDVEIRLGTPALRTRRLTATFTGESADDAIAFVASVLDLQVARVGGHYTLRTR